MINVTVEEVKEFVPILLKNAREEIDELTKKDRSDQINGQLPDSRATLKLIGNINKQMKEKYGSDRRYIGFTHDDLIVMVLMENINCRRE